MNGVNVASFPGSPLAPTKNKNGFIFVGARGEPGNEASVNVCTGEEEGKTQARTSGIVLTHSVH